MGPNIPVQRGGAVAVRLKPDKPGPALVAALEKRRIQVDHRSVPGLRVSPPFYLRLDEFPAIAASLSELRDFAK